MAIRKRTIRRMSPLARKLAKLANESQSTTRKLKWLIGEVQELEWEAHANKLKSLNEEDVFNVQPEDKGGSDTQDLSDGKNRQSRDDQVGQSGNRASTRRKRRSKRRRNKKRSD